MCVGFIREGLNRLFFVGIVIIISIYVITKLITGAFTVNEEKPEKPIKNSNKAMAKKFEVPDLVKSTRRSIVQILSKDNNNELSGQGTGFFCKEGGWIVTNYHVIENAEKILVNGYFGKKEVKYVYDIDQKNDLALLKLEGKRKWPYLKLSSKKPAAGEKIVVIGSPLGLTNTVSDGIIAGIRDFNQYSGVIQVTSPISPGSSGSPVMNMYGDVVGIATFQLDIGQNLNFAIPASRISKLKGNRKTDVNEKKEILVSESINSSAGPMERGKAYLDAGLYRKSGEIFEKLIKEEPENAEGFHNFGLSLKGLKNIKAVEMFRKAIEINPDSVESYFELGKTYRVLNMNEEAVTALLTALKLRPWFYEIKEELGELYCIMGYHKKAVKTLEEAIEHSDSPKPFTALGMSYYYLDKNGKAIRCFKNALKIEPDYLEAHKALGYTFAKVKNWSAGIKAMNEAILIVPGEPSVHYLLGLMHLGNGDSYSVSHEIAILKNIRKDKKKSYSDSKKREAGKLSNELEKLLREAKRGY